MPIAHPKRAVVWLSLLSALAAFAVIVPAALANAGDPDSTQASWQYASGTSGPVNVTVTGTWSWGDNSVQGGGKDSQSCWNGGKENTEPGYNDANGHWAVGLAVSWNDSSTPNVLTGKASDGSTVTLHVGNAMDWTNPNYCAGTTPAAPYPSGTFTATHEYTSLSEFLADTNNGQMCANAYDVHKPNDANEGNPAKNGDNTLKNGHYALNVDCAAAQNANTATPAAPGAPAAPAAPAPAAPAPAAPAAAPATPSASLAISKLERDETVGGAFVPGPLNVNVGDRVDYEIHVMNNGNVALTMHLVDAGCTIRGGHTLDFGGVALAVDHTLIYHCSHVITAANAPKYTNTATANGVSASGTVAAGSSVSATPESATVVANVTPAKVLAAHKVVKHAKPAKHLKPVVKKAKAAPKVVKAASFTG
jgi:hypothetical protein